MWFLRHFFETKWIFRQIHLTQNTFKAIFLIFNLIFNYFLLLSILNLFFNYFFYFLIKNILSNDDGLPGVHPFYRQRRVEFP